MCGIIIIVAGRPVGQRLAVAAFNTAYGGQSAYTGPTLRGCTLNATTLVIEFDTGLLRGDSVALQPFSEPDFTPYYHGFSNPAFHGGSQLCVRVCVRRACSLRGVQCDLECVPGCAWICWRCHSLRGVRQNGTAWRGMTRTAGTCRPSPRVSAWKPIT